MGSFDQKGSSDERHLWLKMHFQPNDVAGVLDLDMVGVIGNTSDTPVNTVELVKSGGKVTWSDPIMTKPPIIWSLG